MTPRYDQGSPRAPDRLLALEMSGLLGDIERRQLPRARVVSYDLESDSARLSRGANARVNVPRILPITRVARVTQSVIDIAVPRMHLPGILIENSQISQ